MKPWVRWLVPLTILLTVTGAVAIASASADQAPELPAKTPQQLLEAVAAAEVTALSGTVVTRADLGLPTLPQAGGHGQSSPNTGTDPQGLLLRFLTGENTLRIWADGPTRQRIQVVDPLAELNVVRRDNDVWLYSSGTNSVRHEVLPSAAGAPASGHAAGPTTAPSSAAPSSPSSSSPSSSSLSPSSLSPSSLSPSSFTPAELAKRALTGLDPSTAVTVDPPATVAGRPAYQLALTPRTGKTLVERVIVAVDSTTGVPLRVTVRARGQATPALEAGFTAVDFSRPDPKAFDFTPAPGATSATRSTPMPTPSSTATSMPTPGAAPQRPATRPRVIDSGWTTILEFPAGSVSAATSAAGETGTAPTEALRQLTTDVDGGQALSTALLSVLITKDGRLLVGAVPVEALSQAARG